MPSFQQDDPPRHSPLRSHHLRHPRPEALGNHPTVFGTRKSTNSYNDCYWNGIIELGRALVSKEKTPLCIAQLKFYTI